MRGLLKTAADIFAVFRLHGAKMRVLRSENRVSGAKCRRADDDALYGKVVSGNIHLTRYCAPSRSVGVRCAGVFGNVRGNAGQKGGYRGRACGKNCVGEDMRGKGRYRRERARGAGRKNGKKRSLSETRACKRSRRASFRLIFSSRFAWFSYPPRTFSISQCAFCVICSARFFGTRPLAVIRFA